MRPFLIETVTATAGHRLKASLNMGFSGMSPFHNSVRYLFTVNLP